jgi:hypothetical protein
LIQTVCVFCSVHLVRDQDGRPPSSSLFRARGSMYMYFSTPIPSSQYYLISDNHTYLYSINASPFATIHYLAVATMLPKRSRVNSLQSTPALKCNEVAPCYCSTASQPVLVDTQTSSPSPFSPLLSPRQETVAVLQAPNFEATLQELRTKDTIITPTEGSKQATVAASKAINEGIKNVFEWVDDTYEGFDWSCFPRHCKPPSTLSN